MTQRLPYQDLIADGMSALRSVNASIEASDLPQILIDLAYLRASQINGCAYCVDIHSRASLRDGLAPDKAMLVATWQKAGRYFDDRERAALAWTETVTRLCNGRVSDEAFEAARVWFDEKELAVLTLAVGLINAYNRLAVSFSQEPVPAARSRLTDKSDLGQNW